MSGGSLDYFYCRLEEHTNDLGDAELNELVSDLATLFHDREWYLSGDTGSGDWNESRDKFKAKWFTEHGRQERIETYLAELTKEVRREFGMSEEYCEFCQHWTKKKDSRYGDCEFEPRCLFHRREYCDKFEKRVKQNE